MKRILRNKKYLYKLTLLSTGLLTILIFIVIYLLLDYVMTKDSNKPTQLVNLTNSSSYFVISKMGNDYMLESSMSGQDKQNYPYGTVTIGKTAVDVNPYLGQHVRIEGSIPAGYTNVQCIINHCHDIAPSMVVDIDSIQEIR